MSNQEHKVMLSVKDERQHIENKKYENQWTLCCSGTTDSNALKYIIQILLGSSVMMFSMVQICLSEPDEDIAIYFSLLSGTLGYFLPSPSMVPNSD